MLIDKLESSLDRTHNLFSRPIFLYAFVLLLFANQLIASREADRDLFARLATGKIVLETHTVPTQDPFSFAPKKAKWIDHEWLAGVIFQSVLEISGESGLLLLRLTLSVLTILILLAAVRARLPNNFALTIYVTSLLLDCTYLWSSAVRSQIFTYLTLAYILLSIKREKFSPATVFALMLINVNAHGGFIVPLMFLGAFSFYSRSRDALLAFGLSLLATFITPYPGIEFHRFLAEALSMPRPSITEWQPLQILSLNAVLPLLTLALVLYGIALNCSKVTWFHVVFILVSAFAGFRSTRFMAIFYFSVIVFGSVYLENSFAALALRLKGYSLKIGRATALVMVCLMIWAASTFLFAASKGALASLTYEEYPTELSAKMLGEGLRGKLLCDFNLGSYLLWRLYPSFQIAIDGRYEEVYPDSTLALVEAALQPSGANHYEALKLLSPDYLLVDTKYRAVSGWERYRVALRDTRFVLFDLKGM